MRRRYIWRKTSKDKPNVILLPCGCSDNWFYEGYLDHANPSVATTLKWVYRDSSIIEIFSLNTKLWLSDQRIYV